MDSDEMKPDLVLTEKAIEQVKRLLARDQRQDCGLRVSVSDGGCSGHSYRLDFDREQRPDDAVLEWDGVRVFIDAASVPYLQGTVIDFVSGFYGGGFKFINPNATATCGCGTSFSV